MKIFDIEQSIAEWRRQVLAAGVKSPVPLDELESHLRDEFEQQIKSGLNETEAFTAAVEKIGPAEKLDNEFRKQADKFPKGAPYLRVVASVLFGSIGWALSACLSTHSGDPFILICGRLILIGSIMGAVGMCLQAAVMYLSKPKSRK